MADKKHRSAVTGRYVKEGYAKRYPDKTVSETPKGSKGSKDKPRK